MSHLIISENCPIIENILQSNKTMEFNSTDNQDLYIENKNPKLGPNKRWRLAIFVRNI